MIRLVRALQLVLPGVGIAFETLMTPPKLQAQMLCAVASGMPRCLVQVEGGAQGVAVTGMQGIGVSTP